MRKFRLWLSVSGCFLMSAAAAQEVYVDLSVLDQMDGGSSASRQLPFDDSSLQSLPRPVVRPHNKPKLKAAPKTVPPQPSKPKFAPATITPPPPKPAVVVKETTVDSLPARLPEPAVEKKVPVVVPVAAPITEPVLKKVPETAVTEEKADVAAVPVQENKQPVVADLLSTRREAASEVLEPLIPVGEPEIAADTIVFMPGRSDLSSENLEKLAELADGFRQPGSNKIIISAFNYDDGENSFKSKRLNLNRAVAVRSYLMTRGYTNFSIKIINTDNQLRKNTAEVTEEAD